MTAQKTQDSPAYDEQMPVINRELKAQNRKLPPMPRESIPLIRCSVILRKIDAFRQPLLSLCFLWADFPCVHRESTASSGSISKLTVSAIRTTMRPHPAYRASKRIVWSVLKRQTEERHITCSWSEQIMCLSSIPACLQVPKDEQV